MSRAVRFAPLVLFLLLVAALVWRLSKPADTIVTSKLQGKPVPEFSLPPAVPGKPGLASAELKGEPRLLNIFASWCVPCVTEVKVLQDIARQGVAIDGIAVRDRSEDVAAFLARYGDPYRRIGSDLQSQLQIALGSSGVPETFVVDSRGIIRHQHIGPVEAGDVPALLAELEKAR